MSNSWPDADEVASIFKRFVQGDRVAQSDFILAVLDPLLNHLEAWRRDVDEHTRITAAEDAVLSVIRNPAIYDKTKGNLITFLCMAARRDLLNAVERERRHHRDRENLDSVEFSMGGRNPSVEEEEYDLPSFDDPALATEIASFTDIERRVFELMRTGERRSSVVADLLGIGHLPNEELAREVKRVKERIFKRLQRAGRKS
jgi:DNA-directed RNA polymerase specialized sigma24 family protein